MVAATDSQAPKPGYRTTEFYVTILTLLLPLATLIFKTDLSPLVQPIAAAGAGIATAAYAISRAWTKSASTRVSAAVEGPQPTVSVATPPSTLMTPPASMAPLTSTNPSAVVSATLPSDTMDVQESVRRLTAFVNSAVTSNTTPGGSRGEDGKGQFAVFVFTG